MVELFGLVKNIDRVSQNLKMNPMMFCFVHSPKIFSLMSQEQRNQKIYIYFFYFYHKNYMNRLIDNSINCCSLYSFTFLWFDL